MRVSVENTANLERRLTIVVPGEEFESEVSTQLAATRHGMALPGFRPGKVPLKEVRRRFGDRIRAEIATEMMADRLGDAIEQENLEPAGPPDFKIVTLETGADFEFTATFEVAPPVELADFSTLSIIKPQCEITAADIDDMVEQLREQRKEWVTVERGAQDGDQVTLDFAATLDGEPVEDGEAKDFAFVVGDGVMVDDFDQAVRGLSPGEAKEFPAEFPDDHQDENLAGRTADFAVQVNTVEEPRLPEVDEAFIKDFGVDDGGMEAFRAQVSGNMRREIDAVIRRQLKTRVMDALHKAHPMELPEALVQQQLHDLKEQMLRRIRDFERDPDDLPDDLFREGAERTVLLRLVSREIINSYKLRADEERVRKRIEELAEPYAEKDRVVDWYYDSDERLRDVEAAVLEDRVLETVLDQAQVEWREHSYSEIIAGSLLEAGRKAQNDAEAKDEAPASPTQ